MYIFNRLLIDVIEIILVYTRSYDAYDALTKKTNNSLHNKNIVTDYLTKKLSEIARKNRIIDNITVVKRFSNEEIINNISGLSKKAYLDNKELGLNYMNVDNTFRYVWGYFNNNEFITNRLHNKPSTVEKYYYSYSNDRPYLLPFIITRSNRRFDSSGSYNPNDIFNIKNFVIISWNPKQRYNLPYRVDTYGCRIFTRYINGEHEEQIYIFKYL